MEAALKKEAIQKKDTELEAFLIDMQTTAGSNDEVQSEPEAEAEAEGPCSYLCLNRAGVIFNILLIIVLLVVIIFICAKMMLEN
jgi:hypothetical protein